MVQLTKDESRAITLAKVICMFCVVFIHAAIKKYTDCSPLVEFYYNFLTRVLVNFAVPGFLCAQDSYSSLIIRDLNLMVTK